MAPRVEDGVKLGSSAPEALQGLSLSPELLLGLVELDRVGVFEVLDGLLVDRSLAALGRGDGDLCPGRVELLAIGVLPGERIEGVGELGLQD